MFDYVSGNIAFVGENKVVIDCGGVGFSLTASAFACAECSRKTQARMPVYLAVRDDALELFGFANEKERELFLSLITVSGVGPKLAITVLGGMPTERLAAAVSSGDVAALSTVKGVGKKTAERIVLELKNKIGAIFGEIDGSNAPMPAAESIDEKAVLALVSLGYERKEAEAAVKKTAKPDMSTEEIVRAALRG